MKKQEIKCYNDFVTAQVSSPSLPRGVKSTVTMFRIQRAGDCCGVQILYGFGYRTDLAYKTVLKESLKEYLKWINKHELETSARQAKAQGAYIMLTNAQRQFLKPIAEVGGILLQHKVNPRSGNDVVHIYLPYQKREAYGYTKFSKESLSVFDKRVARSRKINPRATTVLLASEQKSKKPASRSGSVLRTTERRVQVRPRASR